MLPETNLVAHFNEEVMNLLYTDEGAPPNLCVHCAICSATCPAVEFMDHSPRQLLAMINAGMNLMKCLDILRGQTNDERLRATIDDLRNDVQAGQSLTDAMAKHPGVFSALYVNMIRAAEAGGILDQILNRLAGYLENEMETSSKMFLIRTTWATTPCPLSWISSITTDRVFRR